MERAAAAGEVPTAVDWLEDAGRGDRRRGGGTGGAAANVYGESRDGNTSARIKAKSGTCGDDRAELDAGDNYAGPFVTHDHARQFAADWADSLGFKPRVPA